MHEPGLPRAEFGEPAQCGTGGSDERAHLRCGVVGPGHPEGARGIDELPAEPLALAHGTDQHHEGRRRALLTGAPERRTDDVRTARSKSADGVTTIAFLPSVSAVSGSPARHHVKDRAVSGPR